MPTGPESNLLQSVPWSAGRFTGATPRTITCSGGWLSPIFLSSALSSAARRSLRHHAGQGQRRHSSLLQAAANEARSSVSLIFLRAATAIAAANPDARWLAAAWPMAINTLPAAPCSPARLLLGFRFQNPARSLDRAEGGSRPMDHGHGCHRQPVCLVVFSL